MFQTKKQLKKRIAELEERIHAEQHHTRRSALIDEADLPKCKSTACYNCKYVSFAYHPGNGAMYLLGCGRDLALNGCAGYEHTDANKGPIEEMRYRLLTMVKGYWPDQSTCLSPDCVHLPQPPCHERDRE